MKILLKTIVAVFTLLIGWFLGIYLLDWSVWWKVMLFGFACYFIGHIVYLILRAIDRACKQ